MNGIKWHLNDQHLNGKDNYLFSFPGYPQNHEET